MKAKRPVRHRCGCVTCQRHPHSALAKEHQAINRVLVTLNEKNRRHFVGLLALEWGRGSIERLHQITGLSRPTIRRGRNEVQHSERRDPPGRTRRAGAGRPAVEKNVRES